MKLSSVSLLALLAFVGCAQPIVTSPTKSTSSSSQSREARTSQLREKLKSVTVADGISKSEAELIAECYFHQNVGCGGFTGIEMAATTGLLTELSALLPSRFKASTLTRAPARLRHPSDLVMRRHSRFFRRPALQRTARPVGWAAEAGTLRGMSSQRTRRDCELAIER